ncbi:hypothetical protein Tsp_09362 [Trichinella spiralis]|uniref:hypothetical protein n=1 Tax=Trichinella spiralis TaxID=6334 RepID=UPI0001EFCB18|nr:hypothetical protein Tsp_09362 [Trichinella spiralis]
MESTSCAIFLCTRHNVAGNFSYKHDIVPGKSAQDKCPCVILKASGGCALRPVRMVSRDFARRRCVVISLLKSRCDKAVELSWCNSLCNRQAATTARFSAFENKFHHHFFDLKRGLQSDNGVVVPSTSIDGAVAYVIKKASVLLFHLVNRHYRYLSCPRLLVSFYPKVSPEDRMRQRTESYWLTTYEHLATVVAVVRYHSFVDGQLLMENTELPMLMQLSGKRKGKTTHVTVFLLFPDYAERAKGMRRCHRYHMVTHDFSTTVFDGPFCLPNKRRQLCNASSYSLKFCVEISARAQKAQNSLLLKLQ